MNTERGENLQALDPRARRAVDELRAMISRKYPGMSFELARGHDEPENIHLKALVDLDDADAVLDLVGERLDQLQVEEGVPIYVIPLRTPERVLAALEEVRHAGRG
jgi:hypothetical protein